MANSEVQPGKSGGKRVEVQALAASGSVWASVAEKWTKIRMVALLDKCHAWLYQEERGIRHISSTLRGRHPTDSFQMRTVWIMARNYQLREHFMRTERCVGRNGFGVALIVLFVSAGD